MRVRERFQDTHAATTCIHKLAELTALGVTFQALGTLVTVSLLLGGLTTGTAHAAAADLLLKQPLRLLGRT